MIEPGKSTLWRMRMTAAEEATRIEIAQDARVAAGLITEPMPDQVAKRDDFASIVRLIDAIMADSVVLERLPR
jgi:hypothetical protein